MTLVSALFVSGCGVSGNYRSDGPCKGFHKNPRTCERAYENSLVAGKIQIGQSRTDVRATMGHDPEQREATADYEKWSFITDYDNQILMVIIFKQGVVAEIKQTNSPHD